MRLPLALAFALAACGGIDTPASPDATGPDAADVPIDAAPPLDAPEPTCDVSSLPAYRPIDVVELSVRPSETAAAGETISDVVSGQLKRHLVTAPGAGGPLPSRAFLWLSGSGAEPYQYRQIMNIAASLGYVAISLAYDNETSVADLCSQSTPACNSRMNLACGDQVRRELIYGDVAAPSECIEVAPSDAIVHRVVRLVEYLDRMYPVLGARAFLSPAGDDLAWDKWAIGGWSQGGGHAGIMAGDHRVERAIYMSKGSDAVLCALTTTDPDRDCDLDGNGMLDLDNQDEMQVPAPAAFAPRATPGARQFGFVHELEGAWNFSRETFEAYGMGAKGDEVRLDGRGPYPAAYAEFGCAHTFSIIAPAGGADPTDYHKSMAIDPALARDADGIPILAPGLVYALAVPLE